ncbi:hypothetical protein PBPRC0065 (plasmid) [Photobacterium profundum SS9]|uniref:Uncharacterized protein n=1 Tax=Photobacterium profundum (strain SS9) TaxID=298386 RepID=Q6LW69_PHOPR|nr:hypothetical protein PBPRC0065 [Photobacterium profundum SS9]
MLFPLRTRIIASGQRDNIRRLNSFSSFGNPLSGRPVLFTINSMFIQHLETITVYNYSDYIHSMFKSNCLTSHINRLKIIHLSCYIVTVHLI